ncbi:MAG: sodium/proline symporter [Maricaulaceae bacterium]
MDGLSLWLAFFAYNGLLIGLGVWARGRTTDVDSFFIAKRELGPLTAGLSYAASASSAWVLLGLSGYAFANGLDAIWILPGVWAGYAVAWLALGKRLREEAETRGHLSLVDFLVADAPRRHARWLAALAGVLIVISLTAYVATQLDGAGKTFERFLDLPYGLAVGLGAGVVLIYTVLGGFWAASVSDAVQGLIILLVTLVLPIAAVLAAGGTGSLIAELQANTPEGFLVPDGGFAGLSAIGFASGLFGTGPGALGQPHVANRIMALRSEAERKTGFWVAFGWVVVVYSLMVLAGLSARALIPTHPESETALLALTAAVLPSAFAGLALAAVLSAIMSTADSLLLASANAVERDLGLGRLWRGAELTMARASMVLVTLIATLATLFSPDAIFARALFAWGAIGAAFGPVVIARVLDWRCPPWSVGAAMASGFGLTVVLHFQPDTPGDLAERLAGWLPAFAFLLAGRRR